jgi:sigma-E factor negative regulatory protein RseA
MPEDLNQKISQFLDNELDHDEALTLLQKMQLQSELQDKMNRYEAISHALKTDVFLAVESDFSASIRQQIQQEPFYLLPQSKSIKRGHKLIALAASIAIVAVITERSMNNNPAEQLKAASILQVAQQQPPKPVVYTHQAEQPPLNARINDYLQAHNSSVYTNGEANFQPFARVTAYSQK